MVVEVGGGDSRNNPPLFFKPQERLPVEMKGPQLFYVQLSTNQCACRVMCAPSRFAGNRFTVQFSL